MDTQAGRAKSYYFPRKPEDDVIVNILKTVGTPVGTDNPCHGNDATRYGTSDGRTVVRVAMHGITRTEVAKQLVALDQAACYVDVVYRRMSDDVKKIFDAHKEYGGVALHRLENEREDETKIPGNTATHSKYLLVEGTYNGKANQKIVFTGSRTYTNSALTHNDEALLKWDDSTVAPTEHQATVYDAYRQNFRDQRTTADAQPLAGNRPQPAAAISLDGSDAARPRPDRNRSGLVSGAEGRRRGCRAAPTRLAGRRSSRRAGSRSTAPPDLARHGAARSRRSSP